ncbi:MAG TPA: M14 family zinc carboxypeptidase [Candidatus Limnocylindrales bacterium]|nr:M14 family zinc carboxypeptidase [Candidatus Limnocylindrales bacterium]
MPLVRRRLAVPLLLAALILGAAPVAAANEFPAGYEGFHTYAEMVADITAVQAAHPDIVRTFSIGTSDKGRTIWAAKVSDNVSVDEPEPEVLFDGLHHSDEHMGLEMTLRILHWLANGYGTDQRITDIVNTREVWIIFAVNPDGAEYDISGGRFHHWRKNRQPNAGTTAIGTDLNRNYGYHWGGGGLTSTNPKAITYRGPSAFSAPETRAVRDFLASRVVDGRQQIRVAISFHEYGRLVMWPYGYTTRNVPADMTTQDHDALAAIGRHMAATNGYTPEQASDLYVTSGTTRDYEYGRYRIFSYTFELSAVDYPKDTRIATETGRNKEAVLYLAERAWCPLSVLGTAVSNARCGAFDDDLEVARGWTRNPDGTDTAPAGARLARGDPAATSAGGVIIQPGRTSSGRYAYVTGLPAGSTVRSNDLDGRTTIRSPRIELPSAAGQSLTFRWFLAHGSDSTKADHLRAIVEAADGTQTVAWERTGSASLVSGAWRTATVSLDAWAGQAVRIRFEAADGGASSLVEAGVDDIRVTRPGA